MIDEEKTLAKYGYVSDALSHGSGRHVVAICDGCGKRRDLMFFNYRELCIRCAQQNRSDETLKRMSDSQKGKKLSDETKKKISESTSGEKHHNYGKHPSDESRKKMSESTSGDKHPLYGKHHSEDTRKKMSESHIGKRPTDATKKKLSEALSGENHPMYGKHHSEEQKKKMSESHRGEKSHNYGKRFPEETKKRMSAAKQGIAYEDWEQYVSDSPYCPAFNEECKESNREKYGRKCFICGMPESENIDSAGKHKKLFVHHVDMNKLQGCNGHTWKLVPVCMHCHTQLHSELWKSRIVYLLNDAVDCKVVER